MKQLNLFIFLLIIAAFYSFEKISLEITSENLDNSFAVVQLFTSQGCSSCPSADKLLGKVKRDFDTKNVFVLSYHIDYWDRLGWKDPFSNSDYTLLQAAYGFVFNSRSNYTPQAIINGKIHFVGSEEKNMYNYLNTFLTLKSSNLVSLNVSLNKSRNIYFEYDVKGNLKNKVLKVALVIDRRETSINNGENKGVKLINRNVVVNEITIPLNNLKGKEKIKIPHIVLNTDSIRLISYIQKKDYSITGAAQTILFKLY